MKIRFGALALLAALAACSSQDETKTGESQKGSQASAVSPGVGKALAGLANDSRRTLGSAPDRGELFEYKKDASVVHEGAYTLHPIALSEEHAIRGVATGMMTIAGPSGDQIKIRYDRHEENPDGNWSWIGHVVGGDAGREAIITFGEHAVFGSIPQANGPSLQLTTERGIAYVAQADASRLIKGTRVGGDTRIAASYNASRTSEADSLVASAMQKIQAQALAGDPKAVSAANTVDLVAGYSNGLATRLGGASAAVTKLVNLVAVANTALLNSNVSASIRLVNAMQVTYADNTDNGAALDELTGNNGVSPVTVPAGLVPLRTARETYGADLVTLVRDFKAENNGCGIAWLLGSNGSPITNAGDSPFAYSVVSEGSYNLSGNTYYCEDITLVHELAHNMGSAHDEANAGGDAGRYPYSYGYKTTVADGNFFTVMAYGDNNQTLYRVFSNPSLTICGGRACGVVNLIDNARSLRQTVPVIAAFRNTVVPIPGLARNDVNGDGKSDVLFANGTTRQFSYRLMNGTVVTSSKLIGGVGAGYTVAATGDFNGDGKLDLVWTSGNLDLYVWLGNGSTFTSVKAGTYPAGWKVVGTGDVNGDGKSDIIFHNAATRQLSYRIMNGAVTTRSGLINGVGAGYTVAAIGDFNGDGKADLVWTSNNLDLYMWTGNGNTFTSAAFGTYPAGWKVVGAGDVDADGKSDVLFHNATTRQFSYRIMNGTITTRSGLVSGVGAGYTVGSTGDFNGDGKLDLVWTSANRDLYMWTGNGSTFTSARFGDYPTGWSLIN